MEKLKKKLSVVILKLNNEGNVFIDMAMKVGVIVIIAAAVLTILEVAIPGLFSDLISKIEETLNLGS